MKITIQRGYEPAQTIEAPEGATVTIKANGDLVVQGPEAVLLVWQKAPAFDLRPTCGVAHQTPATGDAT